MGGDGRAPASARGRGRAARRDGSTSAIAAARFARVVRLFRAATVTPRGQLAPTMAAIDAETAIAKLTPRPRSRKERAEAEVMLGILLTFAAGNAEGSLGGGQGSGSNLLLEQARGDFQDGGPHRPGERGREGDLELLLQNAERSQGAGPQQAPREPEQAPPLGRAAEPREEARRRPAGELLEAGERLL